MLIVKKMPILQGFPDFETVLEMLLRMSIFHHYFMILKPLDWDEIHLFYI